MAKLAFHAVKDTGSEQVTKCVRAQVAAIQDTCSEAPAYNNRQNHGMEVEGQGTHSSLRVYHFEIRKRAPGKKAASTNPRKNRVRSAPVKLCVAPVRTEIMPQMIMHVGRYSEGLPI